MTTFANTTRRGRVKSRTTSSAAAFCGVIGLPDPGRGPDLHDGGLRAFASEFNQRADAWLSDRSPECRAFAQAERQAASVFRR